MDREDNKAKKYYSPPIEYVGSGIYKIRLYQNPRKKVEVTVHTNIIEKLLSQYSQKDY